MQIALVLIGRTVPGFNDIASAIAKEFKAKITTELIDFPMTRSFRSERDQYDAEILLKDLRKFMPLGVDRAVFMMREDVFAGRLSFVFGVAMGGACLVSTARLDPRFYGEKNMEKARALFIDRVIKEVVHELGHTFGLPHCDDKKCVMVFSNSITDVDYKGADFCKYCSKALYRKEIKDV